MVSALAAKVLHDELVGWRERLQKDTTGDSLGNIRRGVLEEVDRILRQAGQAEALAQEHAMDDAARCAAAQFDAEHGDGASVACGGPEPADEIDLEAQRDAALEGEEAAFRYARDLRDDLTEALGTVLGFGSSWTLFEELRELRNEVAQLRRARELQA